MGRSGEEFYTSWNDHEASLKTETFKSEFNSIVNALRKDCLLYTSWERIRNDNEPDNSMDGFQEIPTEEMEQLGLPEEWL